jgi:large subunit ribosomal protein L29
MKRKDNLKELRGLDRQTLLERAQGISEELMKLRFRKAARQLEQSHRIKEQRRQLARVRSMVSELDRKSATPA